MPNDDDRTATSTGESVDPALDATQLSPGHTPPSSPLSDQAALPPGARIGRYEVRDVLGSGGMGVVYRARDPELDRELAIKVVLPGSASARAQQRLLDEARAMAKLRHPNVVPVFDVGTTDHGVYIVMPLVSGGTIHDWLRAERRPWRQVLERFMAAGRGLEAAHRAGLIHRDFKPKNVLIGDGGEVLVADFGISARTDSASSDAGAPQASVVASSIAGTPAYMAPEQAERGTVDARADQYSYCVSLWEGLHGERPRQAPTRTQSVWRGQSPPAVSDPRRAAPRWLLAAVARGFTPDPRKRWPSMSSLLRHIQTRPKRTRMLAGAAALTAIAGASAATALLLPARPPTCPAPTERLAQAWSPEIRARIEAAFAAVGVPYAADTLGRILPALDAYARAWRDLHIQACRATHVHHFQSADLLDRQMACLNRRLAVLRGQTQSLVQATPATLQRALEHIAEMPPVEDCTTASGKLSDVPMPSAPKARVQIRALEAELAKLDELAQRDQPTAVLERARSLSERTRPLGYPPLHGEALAALALAETDNATSAEATLRELASVAAAAHNDRLAVWAWSNLISTLTEDGRLEEATTLEPVAEASLLRAGSAQPEVYFVRMSTGMRAAYAGDHALALTRFRQALDAAPNDMKRALALRNLGGATYETGNARAAVTILQESLALLEKGMGPRHPEVANSLHMLSQILDATGDPLDVVRSLDAAKRALAIRREAFGDRGPAVAATLQTLANMATTRGDLEEAERLMREAIPAFEASHEDRSLAMALVSLADAIAAQRGLPEAKPLYERALTVLERSSGRDTRYYAGTESNYAAEYVKAGDCKQAMPLLEHALGHFASRHLPDEVFPLTLLAECRSDDDGSAAIDLLERADAICRASGCASGAHEDVLDQLGRLLVSARRNRSRGIKLVRDARRGYEQLGNHKRVAELDAWLDRH